MRGHQVVDADVAGVAGEADSGEGPYTCTELILEVGGVIDRRVGRQ